MRTGDATAFQQDIAPESIAPTIARRTLFTSALAGALLATVHSRPGSAQNAAGAPLPPPGQVWTYPAPGTVTASPGTQLSFRAAGLAHMRPITVIGSSSGIHSGVELPHSDRNGVSWLPDVPFHPGESVEVRTRWNIAAGAKTYSFTVARPVLPSARPVRNTEPDPGQIHHFRSRPDLAPQVITVESHRDELAPGLLFIAPKRGAGRDGAQIIDNHGEPVWFFPAETADDQIMDFRVQQFHGKPVLTWWQGLTNLGRGFGHWVIRDRSYQLVATIQIGNGLPGGDLHDFQLTPQNTALAGTYNEIQWDLTSLDGPVDGTAVDAVIQEIDIPTGAVIFEWHSLDHIALDETYETIDPAAEPEPVDYFHWNSVALDRDGHLVLSARNTWAAYKIARGTGEVIWRLGGKRGDFAMAPNSATALQHDIRPRDNGELSIFDNGSETPEPAASRGLVLRVDQTAMTVEIDREYRHPDAIFAANQGNLQLLPDGNAIVGWGSQPVLSEFNRDGQLVRDWRLPAEKQTYRAYKFEWTATPAGPPALVVERDAAGNLAAYVSWNGATNVASWQLLTGVNAATLASAGEPAPRLTFETALPVPTGAAVVAVQALDATGRAIGESTPVTVPA